MTKLQKLANKIIGLSDDDIINLNCLIAGNELKIVKEVYDALHSNKGFE